MSNLIVSNTNDKFVSTAATSHLTVSSTLVKIKSIPKNAHNNSKLIYSNENQSMPGIKSAVADISLPFCHHRAHKSGEYRSCGFCRGLSYISVGVGTVCGCLTQSEQQVKKVSFKQCRTYKKASLCRPKTLNKRVYCRQTYSRPKPYDRPHLTMDFNSSNFNKMGVLYGTSYLIDPRLSLEDYPFTKRSLITKENMPIIHSRFGLHYPVANFQQNQTHLLSQSDNLSEPSQEPVYQNLRHEEQKPTKTLSIGKNNFTGLKRGVVSGRSLHRSQSVSSPQSAKITSCRPSSTAAGRALLQKFPMERDSQGIAVTFTTSTLPVTADVPISCANNALEPKDEPVGNVGKHYECIFPMDSKDGKFNTINSDCSTTPEIEPSSSDDEQKNMGKFGDLKESVLSNFTKAKLKEKRNQFRRFTTSIIPGQLFNFKQTTTEQPRDSNMCIGAIQETDESAFSNKSVHHENGHSPDSEYNSYVNQVNTERMHEMQNMAKQQINKKCLYTPDDECNKTSNKSAIKSSLFAPVPAPRTVFSSLKSPLGNMWSPRTFRKQYTNKNSDKNVSNISASTSITQRTDATASVGSSVATQRNVGSKPGHQIFSFGSKTDQVVEFSQLKILHISNHCTSNSPLPVFKKEPTKDATKLRLYSTALSDDYSDKYYFTPSKLPTKFPGYSNIPFVTTPNFKNGDKEKIIVPSIRINDVQTSSSIISSQIPSSIVKKHILVERSMSDSHEYNTPSKKVLPSMTTSLLNVSNPSYGCITSDVRVPRLNEETNTIPLLTSIFLDLAKLDGDFCIDETFNSTPTEANKSTPSIGSIWSAQSVNTVIRRKADISTSVVQDLDDATDEVNTGSDTKKDKKCKARRNIFANLSNNEVHDCPDDWEAISLLDSAPGSMCDDTLQNDIGSLTASVLQKSVLSRLSPLYNTPSRWYSTWHVGSKKNNSDHKKLKIFRGRKYLDEDGQDSACVLKSNAKYCPEIGHFISNNASGDTISLHSCPSEVRNSIIIKSNNRFFFSISLYLFKELQLLLTRITSKLFLQCMIILLFSFR